LLFVLAGAVSRRSESGAEIAGMAATDGTSGIGSQQFTRICQFAHGSINVSIHMAGIFMAKDKQSDLLILPIVDSNNDIHDRFPLMLPIGPLFNLTTARHQRLSGQDGENGRGRGRCANCCVKNRCLDSTIKRARPVTLHTSMHAPLFQGEPFSVLIVPLITQCSISKTTPALLTKPYGVHPEIQSSRSERS
jgi:hypothetical protein